MFKQVILFAVIAALLCGTSQAGPLSNLDFELSPVPGPTGAGWGGWASNGWSETVVNNPANGGNQYIATRTTNGPGLNFMENNNDQYGNDNVKNRDWYFGAWVYYDPEELNWDGVQNDPATDTVRLHFRADNHHWNKLVITKDFHVSASDLIEGQWNWVEDSQYVGDPDPDPAFDIRIDGVLLQIRVEDGQQGVFYVDNMWLEDFSGVDHVDNVAPPLPYEAGMTWDGGIGSWADAKWNTGQTSSANQDMVINADTADSEVTVAADFVDDAGGGPGTGTGPAKSVFVGETEEAKLIVASEVTLEVTGDTSAGEMGKIAIDNLGTLQSDTATIEVDGRLIAGVQGLDTGLLQCAGQLALEEFDDGAGTIYGGADAVNVDWIPGADVNSLFGGVYRVAEYTGTALDPGGEMTNSEGNIGMRYVKNVDYDVDVEGDGSLYAVQVELNPQGDGDTDLDADVDGDDLATFGLAWAPSGTDKTWFDGDFDFDGDIDGDDLAALGLAWAPSGIDFLAGDLEVTAVPEPGTIVMLLIGMAGLLIYRKRR